MYQQFGGGRPRNVAFVVFSRFGVALECNRKPYPCITRTPLCEMSQSLDEAGLTWLRRGGEGLRQCNGTYSRALESLTNVYCHISSMYWAWLLV
jgi:hypothetical protein